MKEDLNMKLDKNLMTGNELIDGQHTELIDKIYDQLGLVAGSCHKHDLHWLDMAIIAQMNEKEKRIFLFLRKNLDKFIRKGVILSW